MCCNRRVEQNALYILSSIFIICIISHIHKNSRTGQILKPVLCGMGERFVFVFPGTDSKGAPAKGVKSQQQEKDKNSREPQTETKTPNKIPTL